MSEDDLDPNWDFDPGEIGAAQILDEIIATDCTVAKMLNEYVLHHRGVAKVGYEITLCQQHGATLEMFLN